MISIMITPRKELLLKEKERNIQIILIIMTEITMVTVKRMTMLQISNKETKRILGINLLTTHRA